MRAKLKQLTQGRSFIFLLAATVIPSATVSAQGPTATEYPSAVATFQRICLVPGTNPEDRVTAIGRESTWSEDSTVTVDVPKMGISRAIEVNYRFDKPLSVRQWSGDVDGRQARLILATFNPKNRYPNLCALVLEGPRNAMSYNDALKAAFKDFGIRGKSVDLAHYFEYAGKVGPDKHPARGEIFSRSLSGHISETTHIYLAY